MMKNSFLNPIDQWLGINREVKTFKIATLFLATLVLILSIFTIMALNLDPIVIKDNGNDRIHYIGFRDGDTPSIEDVKGFVHEFVLLRYRLNGEKLEDTIKNITPLSTDGYRVALTSDFKKDFSGKGEIGKFEQYAANISVVVGEQDVLASFDKIVRLNGVPLVIPTEASFQVVKDSATRWNPYGVLVNGVIEHENK